MADPLKEFEEVMLKAGGKVQRRALRRYSYAECLDDECGLAWQGTSSIGAVVKHVQGSGHTARATYEAAFEYAPAPLAPPPEFEPVDLNKTAKKLRAL